MRGWMHLAFYPRVLCPLQCPETHQYGLKDNEGDVPRNKSNPCFLFACVTVSSKRRIYSDIYSAVIESCGYRATIHV
jgi:hypothetical protein